MWNNSERLKFVSDCFEMWMLFHINSKLLLILTGIQTILNNNNNNSTFIAPKSSGTWVERQTSKYDVMSRDVQSSSGRGTAEDLVWKCFVMWVGDENPRKYSVLTYAMIRILHVVYSWHKERPCCRMKFGCKETRQAECMSSRWWMYAHV